MYVSYCCIYANNIYNAFLWNLVAWTYIKPLAGEIQLTGKLLPGTHSIIQILT